MWVTGISGSGKSTVCEALKHLGHVAIDADRDGFNRWVSRATGEIVVDPPYPVPPGWLGQFAWTIDVAQVASLADESTSHVTYLCGSVENEVDAWRYFDQVVCLVADDDTVRRRLATRTTNEFGKHPDELTAVLGWNQGIEAIYRRLGAAIIDATRPLDDVVREVLALSATS